MFSRIETDVLQALLRCARHRRAANLAALSIRVAADRADLVFALSVLERQGLVNVDGSTLSMTLPGLAVAVSLVPPISRRKPALRLVRSAA